MLALALDPRGNVRNPRVLHDFGRGRGIDGMTAGDDGRIVATAGQGELGGVYVFGPEGKKLAFIPVPEPPTNVEFGDEDGKTLYIIAGKRLYRIKTTMKGYRLWTPPRS